MSPFYRCDNQSHFLLISYKICDKDGYSQILVEGYEVVAFHGCGYQMSGCETMHNGETEIEAQGQWQDPFACAVPCQKAAKFLPLQKPGGRNALVSSPNSPSLAFINQPLFRGLSSLVRNCLRNSSTLLKEGIRDRHDLQTARNLGTLVLALRRFPMFSSSSSGIFALAMPRDLRFLSCKQAVKCSLFISRSFGCIHLLLCLSDRN